MEKYANRFARENWKTQEENLNFNSTPPDYP